MMLRAVLAAGAMGALPYHNIEAAVLPAEVARLDAPARMQAANLDTHVYKLPLDRTSSPHLPIPGRLICGLPVPASSSARRPDGRFG